MTEQVLKASGGGGDSGSGGDRVGKCCCASRCARIAPSLVTLDSHGFSL